MTPEAFCTAVGGTYSPSTMVCHLSVDKENTSGADVMLIHLFNRSESITGGEFYIDGSNFPGTAQFTLTAGSTATLRFTGSTVRFAGGAENAFGLGALGYGPAARGTLNITNGSLGFSDGGAWALSVNSPLSVVNLLNSVATIAGGATNAGIYMMTSGSGSSAINIDTRSTLAVDGLFKSGIGTMAASMGLTAQATIRNSGVLTINGTEGAYGIDVMADGAGSVGTIETTQDGDTTVTGIQYGAVNGGGASFVNTGGSLVIAQNGLAALVRGGGTGAIENSSSGELTLSADQGSQLTGKYGINALAFQSAADAASDESSAELVNSSGGRLSILGGAAADGSAGIMAMAYNEGAGTTHAVLRNDASGTVVIDSGHGSAEGTAGISVLAQGEGATAEVTNAVGGVMTITGDSSNGGYGIGFLAMSGGTGSIVNNGTLTMDAHAIYGFTDGGESQGSFTNTGTVNAAAELMFESKETVVKGELPIELLKPANPANPGEGGWTQATEALASYASSYEANIWTMKDDWAQHSTWTGGTLNFTDIDADSADAAFLQNAFTSAKGDGVEILFKGEALGDAALPSGVAPKFTAAHANELIAKGYAGSVVTNIDLDASAADGSRTALVVGGDSADGIRDSFGFRRLRGVSSLRIEGGRQFVLAGDADGGALIEGGAPVTVAAGGTLALGVEADAGQSRGTLEAVTLDEGRLEARSGAFSAASLHGTGEVRVKSGAELDIRDAEITGSVRNEGALTAQTIKVSGGTLSSSGTLKADGRVTIESTAKLAVDGAFAADTLDVKGVVVKGARAEIVLGAAAQALEAEAAPAQLRSVPEEEASQPQFGIRPSADDCSEGRTDAASLAASPAERKAQAPSPAMGQAFAAFDAAARLAQAAEAGGTPDRHGLWVKILANDGRFEAVRGAGAYDFETEGAMLGAEAQLTHSAKAGVAFGWLDGDMKFNRLNFSWTGYAVNLYGAYQADAFALKGSAGWLSATTEAEKDLDADVWHAGLRAEYGIPVAGMTVSPFMGARVMSGSFEGLESQTVFSIPLGAKLSGTLEAGGWRVKPLLEAAYVRSFGDTDDGDARFLAKNVLRGSIGLKAEKGLWTGELSFDGETGSNDWRSNSLNLMLGFVF